MRKRDIFCLITIIVLVITFLTMFYVRIRNVNGNYHISNYLYFISTRNQTAKGEIVISNPFIASDRFDSVELRDAIRFGKYRGQRSIPKILHQIWNDEYLPTDFVENVKGLTRDNPDPEWKYYFWTKSAGLKFIKEKYPFLYEKANETHNVLRSDILRYLVLYEYGGVYLDLDTISVQPLRNFVNSHTCSLALEPLEHYFEGKRTFLLTNAALLCVRKHPFYTKLILHLQTVYQNSCQRAFMCTGPQMLSSLYWNLNKTNNYAGLLPDVQRSEVFQDVYDLKRHKGRVEGRCKNTTSLLPFQKNICSTWLARGKDKRNISDYALTYHAWYHINIDKLNISKSPHIKKVVPHAMIYGKDF